MDFLFSVKTELLKYEFYAHYIHLDKIPNLPFAVLKNPHKNIGIIK